MSPALDPSAAATRAAHATDRRVREQERRLARPIVQLRQAYEAAATVPPLRVWARWAGRCLDHGLRDPEAARVAEEVAHAVMVEFRDTGADPVWRLAAADAVLATCRVREALG